MNSPLDLPYWALALGVLIGIVHLYWGKRLSDRYNNDIDIFAMNGTGWPAHIKLILGGIFFLVGSSVIILIKLIA